jgi:hypothetical protein
MSLSTIHAKKTKKENKGRREQDKRNTAVHGATNTITQRKDKRPLSRGKTDQTDKERERDRKRQKETERDRKRASRRDREVR